MTQQKVANYTNQLARIPLVYMYGKLVPTVLPKPPNQSISNNENLHYTHSLTQPNRPYCEHPDGKWPRTLRKSSEVAKSKMSLQASI